MEEAAGAFRAAVESGDRDRLHAVLAPEVVFHSPVLYEPQRGREDVVRVGVVVLSVLEDRRYVWHVGEGNRHVFGYTARVGERELEGVDIVRFGNDGRVAELVAMVRPQSGLAALSEAVTDELDRLASF